MSRTEPEYADVNLVVVRGEISGSPTRRELPSGSEVAQFDLRTRVDDGSRAILVSLPVVIDPAVTALDDLHDGGRVVVIGHVRRRFFRVGGSTQSRTEVVAHTVVPVRRRRQVERALTRAAETLSASPG